MKKNTSKFAVIGGQYEPYFYGACETLRGAKRLASMNVEAWDNWQGKHIPKIYRFEDTRPAETFFGAGRVPAPHASPVAIAVVKNGRSVWGCPEEEQKMKININNFLKMYNAMYDFIYGNNDNVAGYHEAVAAFDEFAAAHRDFVGEFARFRGDFISSDREAAAFMFALAETEAVKA